VNLLKPSINTANTAAADVLSARPHPHGGPDRGSIRTRDKRSWLALELPSPLPFRIPIRNPVPLLEGYHGR
jgi:hypothetical protein